MIIFIHRKLRQRHLINRNSTQAYMYHSRLSLNNRFMQRSDVRPSGRLSINRSTAATTAGGFAAERPVGRRYWSIAAVAGAAYRLSIDISCRRQQTRVTLCWKPRETDLCIGESRFSNDVLRFVRLNRQALVMLNGWMTSRHHHRRHGNEDASPANELARALTCIRRDDVVNAYLDDVITTCVRRDSATYADRGSTSAVFPLLGRIAFSGVTKRKGAQGAQQATGRSRRRAAKQPHQNIL